MSKCVLVLKGGHGNGREISLLTAHACSKALRDLGYDVVESDVVASSTGNAEDGALIGALATKHKPDVIFNTLQGRFGGSGVVQGVFEAIGIPYTQSGVLSSALAMNKHQAKVMFKAAGVTVTDHVVVPRAQIATQHVLAPPYIVKPAEDSAHNGFVLVRANDDTPSRQVLSENWQGGEELMVERFLSGRSLSCVVMGDVALGVAEVQFGTESYVPDNKHEEVGVKYLLPAPISPKIYEEVRKMSLRVHSALNCRGITKTDFCFMGRGEGEGELICLSVNTLPMMTPSSITGEIISASGHSFEETVRWMVENASCNR